MRFATSHGELEFNGPLHEDTRVLAIVLDGMIRHMRWPELVVTDVVRSAEENRRIWLPIAQGLIRRHRAGEALTGDDLKRAQMLSALKDSDVEEWARGKFTWHLEGIATAMDLRNTDPETGLPRYADPLTPEEERRLCDVYRLCLPTTKPTRQDALESWLRANARPPDWELITKTHGTGPHWHVARRDHRRIAALKVRTT